MSVLQHDCWRIPVVSGWATAVEVASLMLLYDVDTLVVVDGGRPIGTLTKNDLVTGVVGRNYRPQNCFARDLVFLIEATRSPTRATPVLGDDDRVAGCVPFGAVIDRTQGAASRGRGR